MLVRPKVQPEMVDYIFEVNIHLRNVTTLRASGNPGGGRWSTLSAKVKVAKKTRVEGKKEKIK